MVVTPSSTEGAGEGDPLLRAFLACDADADEDEDDDDDDDDDVAAAVAAAVERCRVGVLHDAAAPGFAGAQGEGRSRLSASRASCARDTMLLRPLSENSPSYDETDDGDGDEEPTAQPSGDMAAKKESNSAVRSAQHE